MTPVHSVNQPIQLENRIVLIDRLPSDTSAYWLVCDSIYRPDYPTESQCDHAISSLPSPMSKSANLSLKLAFIVDESIDNTLPGIIIEEIKGADEVYLNGQLIASTGKFPPQFENASYYSRYYFLPRQLIRVDEPNILRMNLYHPDGHANLRDLQSIVYSFDAMLQKALARDVMFTASSAVLIIISLLMLYHYFRIPGSYDSLGLSSFCLISGLYLILNHQLMINLGLDANSLLRWKTVAFIFAQLALNYYLFRVFEIKAVSIHRAIIIFFLIFGMSCLVWPGVNQLQYFYFFSKLSAFISPMVILIIALVVKREPLTTPQKLLAGALTIYFISLLLDITRYWWFNFFEIRENTGVIIALFIIGIAASFLSVEKYWQYFKGSTYDHLTGTLLRPSFVRRLSEEMQRCRRSDFCLLVAAIDIDQFKLINKNYSLEIGDKALMIISATITRALRQFDLICRLHDDEFCIAATLPGSENTELFLRRLHEEVNASSITLESGEKLNLKATSGAVIYDSKRHETPEMLLLDAEHSVTEAKMKQRGSIQWFDTENPPLQFIL